MRDYTFIDLFSGCGGLSLGFTLAGLKGVFAIEKDSMAFETFAANFLERRAVPIAKFSWPEWLEKKAWPIDDLLSKHPLDLRRLSGQIDILAGGPPCQGFSFAGKRKESDPRNQLFEKYVQVVEAIKPSAIVLENVPGMKVAHAAKVKNATGSAEQSYYDKLKTRLEVAGYVVKGKVLDASCFGVPQRRKRLIVIGIRKELSDALVDGPERAFELLEVSRKAQLLSWSLPDNIPACDAISDLRSDLSPRRPCTDPSSRPGFEEPMYLSPKTTFQKLMHQHSSAGTMDSMRLARHSEEVRNRFALILAECSKGVRMNDESRKRFGLKKHRIYPMSPSEPAPTITTLPDDVLHYAEPRILTVRESARLQSFPDWFLFRGKFTTGGTSRVKECPRYTQVGNAVPPHMARAIGLALKATLAEAIRAIEKDSRGGKASKAIRAVAA
ncbi:MAG: DNA cytosine methyltransferase [Pseudomonadota bacterium]